MSKKHITILLLSFFIGISIQAQHNYLLFDYSVSQFKLSQTSTTSSTLSEKLNRCEGKYAGASYHFALGRKNSIGIGMGLSKINYQKEWLGVFPESNQFGVAMVNGQIEYWSFPVSYTRTNGYGRNNLARYSRFKRDQAHFGFTITYTPSFIGKNSFSVNTLGGADHNTFLSSFNSNEQAFQHSLTIGLSDQFYLLENRIRIDLEPYFGMGSSFFKEGGTNINNLSFGLRCRIGLYTKLPQINIEREVAKGNAEEKKKQLEQKQKEIQEQLNKNKNPK